MTTDGKITHATTAWFEMVGDLMCEAVSGAGLSPDHNVSVIEIFTDGVELSDGLIQGLRLEINGGKPLFRTGVRPDETADIVIKITKAGSYALNTLYSADPNYEKTLGELLGSGVMTIEGDPSRLGSWLGAIHDPIVDHTL